MQEVTPCYFFSPDVHKGHRCAYYVLPSAFANDSENIKAQRGVLGDHGRAVEIVCSVRYRVGIVRVADEVHKISDICNGY